RGPGEGGRRGGGRRRRDRRGRRGGGGRRRCRGGRRRRRGRAGVGGGRRGVGRGGGGRARVVGDIEALGLGPRDEHGDRHNDEEHGGGEGQADGAPPTSTHTGGRVGCGGDDAVEGVGGRLGAIGPPGQRVAQPLLGR